MTLPFSSLADQELENATQRDNLRRATDTIRARRAKVVSESSDWEALREAGRAIKADALAHLDDG
jgi:L-lactate dehydrogenase complex protein LldF